MSTTIYLDVDGVINAVSVNNPSLKITGWEEWRTTTAAQWRILYACGVVDAINTLAARSDVTIKWLTTWEDEAPLELCPALGIDGQQWEVLHGRADDGRGGDWWKLKAIQADVLTFTPERFIWIDDDIQAEPEAIEWVSSRTNGFWISPHVNWGLTASHVEQINDFIDAGEIAA